MLTIALLGPVPWHFKTLVEPITAESVGELVKTGKPARALLDAYQA